MVSPVPDSKIRQSNMTAAYLKACDVRYGDDERPYLWLDKTRRWSPNKLVLEDSVTVACQRMENQDNSYSANYITGVIGQVRRASTRKYAAFDTNPDIIGVPGGNVVELKTGVIREAEAEDLVTMEASIVPEKLPTPAWNKFLKEVTKDDQGIIDWMLRWCGYTLTGHTSEEKAFLLKGEGGNGKGTLIETVRYILGDYAVDLQKDILSPKVVHRHLTTVADLHRKRMLALGEAERGLWNAQFFNMLAEGGTARAHRMRQDPFTVFLDGKMMVGVNRTPTMGSDDSIRRRLAIVPFNVLFGSNPDTSLKARLKEEAPGIFFKMIQESTKWYEEGLLESTGEMEQAVEDWLASSASPLETWFEERCKRDNVAITRRKELHEDMSKYFDEQGEARTPSNRALGKWLRDRGFTSDNTRGHGQEHYGIRLREPLDDKGSQENIAHSTGDEWDDDKMAREAN